MIRNATNHQFIGVLDFCNSAIENSFKVMGLKIFFVFVRRLFLKKLPRHLFYTSKDLAKTN